MVESLKMKFDKFMIQQISTWRKEIAQLTSANEGELVRDIILEYLAKPSIDQQEEIDIQVIEICIIWQKSFLKYLWDGELMMPGELSIIPIMCLLMG